MAHLDSVETRAAGNLDALYWWRRSETSEARPAEPLTQRIAALAERAAPARTVPQPPRIIELPGNRLRANAEARCIVDRAVLRRQESDADMLAAIRRERRSATDGIALSVLATAAPAAAAFYAAARHEPVALGFALAGSFGAAFALYRALCRRLPIRAGDSRKNLTCEVHPLARYRSPGRHL